MGWYAFVSLISDGRIMFLLGFVIVAIIIASVLIFIEIRLKKKKEVEYINVIDKSVIEKIRKFLKSNKTPREKLDFIDKSAKKYFKESYETPLSSDYSKLISEFKKHNRKDEVVFCKKMFSVYYSHKKISNNEIIILGNLFVDIIRKDQKMYLKYSTSPPEGKEKLFSNRRKVILPKEKDFVLDVRASGMKMISHLGNKISGFLGKIKNFFENRRKVAIEKNKSNIERMRIGKREDYKIIRRNAEEIKNWVNETIKLGHDRKQVLDLLSDGKREKKEINNILNIYDGEMNKISSSDKNIEEKEVVKKNEGIAEKIVNKEKARLNGVGFYAA